MRNKNEIDELEEWHEHQLNPGYWINKVHPFLLPKRTLSYWLLSILSFVIIIPAFLFSIWLFMSDQSIYSLFIMGVSGIFSVVAILYVIRFKPIFNPEESQTEIEKRNQIRTRERKRKLQKRRKDYK